MDFIGKVPSTPDTIEAADKKSAVAKAAKQFNITVARRKVATIEERSR